MEPAIVIVHLLADYETNNDPVNFLMHFLHFRTTLYDRYSNQFKRWLQLEFRLSKHQADHIL